MAGNDTSMLGTWVFNDVLVAPSTSSFELEFIANANSNSYTSITHKKLSSKISYFVLRYAREGSDVVAYAFIDSAYNDLKPHWQDDAYRTIEITKEPDEATAAWIRANAKRSDQQQEDDARLKTKSKRIVDAINELADKLAEGNNDTKNDAVGIWVFNDEVDVHSDFEYSIQFTSGGVTYTTISAHPHDENPTTDLFYDSESVYWCYDDMDKGWSEERSRTIEITGGAEITNENFVSWLSANAVKQELEYQTKTDDSLQTEDKTIVGAINEVNAKVNALSGGADGGIVGTWVFNDTLEPLPTTDGYELHFNLNANQTYDFIRYGYVGPPAYVLVYGGSLAYSYESETMYGISPGWQDELYKTIHITEEPTDENLITWLRANAVKQSGETEDGANENALLNIFIDGIHPGSMLSGIITAIEEAGGDPSKPAFVTLRGYRSGQFLMQFNRFGVNIYQITCSNPFAGAVYDDGNGNVYDVTTTTIANFLDATRPAERLPNIRFANFTYVKNEDDDIIAYRFTVENMGGGKLQEGDKLQICCKRTYAGGKQKLRKMAEYEITWDDINQRFLKIEVDPYDDTQQKWLFRNNRIGNSTLSAMCFRLKRVTKTYYNPEEDADFECNAIFSNVETVWKTYSKDDLKFNIK